jgi:hypothetical protein
MATHKPAHKPAPVTTPIGRDARTGHFIPVDQARRDPTHTVVERIPKPGHKPK